MPEPFAIARSMLSFGIEAARAFSIAFWSERFAAGSGPPSFAATMIARVELREELAALRVGGALLVLDRRPLAMPGHVPPPSRCSGTARGREYRRSAPDGRRRRGAVPRAPAPGGRRPPPAPRRPAPASSSHGARMNTARSGSVPSPISRSASKLVDLRGRTRCAASGSRRGRGGRGRGRSSPRTCRGSGRANPRTASSRP